MRKFKKIVYILLGLIAGIAISLYSYLLIRDYRSQSQLVAKEAALLVKVSIDHILNDMLFNAMKNPGYYADNTPADSSQDISTVRQDIGVHIPANLYFFALPADPKALYVVLQVDDENKLHAFIEQSLGRDSIQVEKDKMNWYFSGYENRLSIIGDSEMAILAIALDKNGRKESLSNLWKERKNRLTAVSDLKGFSFEKSGGDIQWKNIVGDMGGKVSISEGTIKSTFFFSNSLLRLPKKAKAVPLPQDNILNFYCHADLSPLLAKYSEELKHNGIPADSLRKYYQGYVDLQWRQGEVIQQDTIVAYDYDDDFNMLEKREVREEAVPNIVLNVKASAGLASVLPQKMFFKFYQQKRGEMISLATDTAFQTSMQPVELENAFGISYTYTDAVKPYLGWLPNIEKISHIKVSGVGADAYNTFSVDINLKDKDIYALYPLFK